MNVVEFKSKGNPIVFCFIDNTHQYQSAWTKELIKNLADFSISNILSKGYDIIQSQDEDSALESATIQGYKHAVVFSTGTEFINGSSFYKEVEKLIQNDYAVYGHILDRSDAYYELHHQCYLINLEVYKKLNCPSIGRVELNTKHDQIIPDRSVKNIHDDYTPTWIKSGIDKKVYLHKLHGWNIVSILLKNGYTISAFNDQIRNNKKHYYPESQKDFLKQISWAYDRYNYCSTEFIHFNNTETIKLDKTYSQIITPASGVWFVDYIDNTKDSTVILYDYNQKALDYWKEHVPVIKNVRYKFVKINLLGNYQIRNFSDDLDTDTLINLSNIFCYEGTAMFYSLEYRLQKEQEILRQIPKHWSILMSERSASGFTDNYNDVKIYNLKKPTWHFGSDWNE